MLNVIWVTMLLTAIVCGACTGKLDAVARASTDSANAAVTLSINLVGVMAFWLGLIRVLQQAGFLRAMARALRPVMVRLFPDVPADHPAMSMMILNITSNMLGLGNAATPFGLKAMMELDSLNQERGNATNAMALFLAINTTGLAVLPTGMVALRASLGSTAPGSIILPTVLATLSAAIVGVIACKALQGWPIFAVKKGLEAARGATDAIDQTAIDAAMQDTTPEKSPVAQRVAIAAGVAIAAAFGYALWLQSRMLRNGAPAGWGEAVKNAIGQWPLLILISAFVLFGVARNVKVYDAMVEGGKEGFGVALRIIPYLVAILVAVGMLRASGAIDALVVVLEPATSLIGMPAEALPMALLRPLTGSGAYAIATDLMKTHGADSLIGTVASTIMGSTETTFYVLALYLGVVGVRNARHALAACLIADAAGVLMAVWTCRILI